MVIPYLTMALFPSRAPSGRVVLHPFYGPIFALSQVPYDRRKILSLAFSLPSHQNHQHIHPVILCDVAVMEYDGAERNVLETAT
jgi:hypothetical protein